MSDNPLLHLVPEPAKVHELPQFEAMNLHRETVFQLSEAVRRAHRLDHELMGERGPHTFSADAAYQATEALLKRYYGRPELLADMVIAIAVGSAMVDPELRHADRAREN